MKMTQAEVDAHQARVARKRLVDFAEAHFSGSACEDESGLHSEIIMECRRRGWLWFHGSMAHKAHRTPGEPDFIIMIGPQGPRHDGFMTHYKPPSVLFVECKTSTGKLTHEQAAIAAHAAKLGHKVHVVRSFAEFLDLL